MQTIIMTVGTSLRTNGDRELPEEKKRPWRNRGVHENKKIFTDTNEPLAWMKSTDFENISAEINTLWRLSPQLDDRLILLHSDTIAGLECAEVIKDYLVKEWEQKKVELYKLPNIDYELEESALDTMAKQVKKLIETSTGVITLAATGGFKAQTMVMGLVGNAMGVQVCYVHEEYKSLVFLPRIGSEGYPQNLIFKAPLPESGRPRDKIISLQDEKAGHHRPKSWKKVEKILKLIPWIDLVYFDSKAFSAPKNNIKIPPHSSNTTQQTLWLHLHENEKSHLAVSIVTTGYKPEHLSEAAAELRERLGKALF